MPSSLTIQKLLQKMKEVEASDLHLKIGSPPVLRVAAHLHRVEAPPLETDDTAQLLAPIIPEHLREQLEERGGIDFSHNEGAEERFRCSVFHAGGGLHAAIRRVNPTVPEFNDLNLPPIYEHMTERTHEGLVIVCGVTGSGKSSTLAAMIDHINDRRACNIITIEDPVEFLFRPKRSYVSQRGIGIDVDVIMIGELRDRETILSGIQAAETGHLVFVTLHTSDTMHAFSRILEFFPSKEHAFIRSSLAIGLKAIMAQRLLPCLKPNIQRVPSTEVLLNTVTVEDKIREAEDEDLPAIMAGSVEEGMHDFTQSLARLVEDDWVDLKTAERYAPNAEALRSKIRGIQVKADVLVSKAKR
jgi:twitching motility protein PilT